MSTSVLGLLDESYRRRTAQLCLRMCVWYVQLAALISAVLSLSVYVMPPNSQLYQKSQDSFITTACVGIW